MGKPLTLNEAHQHVQDVIDFAFLTLTDASGDLRLERTQEGLSPLPIWHDFGDIAPFLLEAERWDEVAKMMERLSDVLHTSRPLVPGPKTLGVLSNLKKSYEYTDLLVGLEDVCRRSPTDFHVKLLGLAFDDVVSNFGLTRFYGSYFAPRARVRFPIVDSRDATFIEVFCDMYETSNRQEYLDAASTMARRFRKIRQRNPHGLLPDFKFPLPNGLVRGRFSHYTLMKNQTNALYSTLRLWEITGEQEHLREFQDHFLHVWRAFSVPENGLSNSFHKRRTFNQDSLKAAFALVDAITDYSLLTRDDSLMDYGNVIESTWEKRLSRLGLFPMSSTDRVTFLDSQTDMVVALYRFGSLRGSDRIVEIADRAFAGLLNYHALRGFPLHVRVSDGNVSVSTVRTKFVFLYLKAVFTYIERHKNPFTVHDNVELRRLIRDR